MTAEELVTVIRRKSPLAHISQPKAISRAEGAYRSRSDDLGRNGFFGEGFHPSPSPGYVREVSPLELSTKGLHPLDPAALVSGKIMLMLTMNP